MAKGNIERIFVSPSSENEHRRDYPDHWERYDFASSCIDSGMVVDVACGCGYGSALIGRNQSCNVVGLDLDYHAVSWACSYYGEFAEFRNIEEKKWPIGDMVADYVVSLETLEHVEEPHRFLAEAERIMSSGGMLILSTPLNESRSRFKPENPFHIREYSWNELGEMIEQHFDILARYTQSSNLSKKIGGLKQNIVGVVASKFTPIVPKYLKNWIVGKLGKDCTALQGVIEEGRGLGATVQIVLAKKKTDRNDIQGI